MRVLIGCHSRKWNSGRPFTRSPGGANFSWVVHAFRAGRGVLTVEGSERPRDVFYCLLINGVCPIQAKFYLAIMKICVMMVEEHPFWNIKTWRDQLNTICRIF